jgi:predicted amidophosphoribosyltransferase
LTAAGDGLFAVMFPSNCRLCAAPLARASRLPVCEACLERIRPIEGPVCAACGDRLLSPHFSERDGAPLCGLCIRVEPVFHRAAAYGSYDAGMRDLIHLLKYEHVRPAAGVLGRMLAEVIAELAEEFETVDCPTFAKPANVGHPGQEAANVGHPGLAEEFGTGPHLPKAGRCGAPSGSSTPSLPLVIPVPLHKAKLRQRGFNQSELIARAALKQRPAALELKLDTAVLARVKATESQTGLTPHQRRENMRGAFAVLRPDAVSGRDILLIDDVFTTGTTASECARVLRRAGAGRVFVATAARALKPEAARATLEEDTATPRTRAAHA